MSTTVMHAEAEVCTFVEALRHLPDDRDNRGKRHALVFVVVGVIGAILSGRAKVSSIFRYIRNRIDWLREVTHHPEAGVISRAHLPRLLARMPWTELNTLIDTHFGLQVALRAEQGWVAIDGKVLRGTLTAGDKQAVVLAIRHGSRSLVAHAPMRGSKASEIPVVRALLKASGLEKHNVPLDAHHCNPTTTAQIQQAGGQYVLQVKANQPLLLQQCQDIAATWEPRSSHTESEKGHGRLTTRIGRCFDMRGVPMAARWSDSGLHTLVVMQRETVTLATQHTTQETAYYISNYVLSSDPQPPAIALTGAIREHWHVEADNWIRDVTLEEDHVTTTSANQAHIMASLRSVALHVLRRCGVTNFRAALEDFADCPSKFEAVLRQVNFL